MSPNCKFQNYPMRSFRIKRVQQLFLLSNVSLFALIQHARRLLQKAGQCNEPNKHQSHLPSRETNSNYDFCYVSLLKPFVLPPSHGDGNSLICVRGEETCACVLMLENISIHTSTTASLIPLPRLSLCCPG